MKKTGGVILLLLFICLFLSACGSDDNTSSVGGSSSLASGSEASATPEPQMAKIVVINNIDSGLNIRDAASTNGNILKTAQAGEKFKLLVDDPEDGWYQIQYNTAKAYVHSDYVTVQIVTLEEANRLNSSTSESSASSASESSRSPESSASASPSGSDSSLDIKEDGQA